MTQRQYVETFHADRHSGKSAAECLADFLKDRPHHKVVAMAGDYNYLVVVFENHG